MIGIFDSGYGGLSILQAIHRALPEYSTMYFGDNAHAPYGDKSDTEILGLTRQGVDTLFQKGCIIVILGCNTASAAALRRLQQEWLPSAWPDRRLLGILVPTVEAISVSLHSHVGVLATPHTVATAAYEREIHKLNPSIKVTQYACNNLAGMIERLGANNDAVQQEAKTCVEELIYSHPSAILLGCTHYEYIADYIASLLPRDTTLIRQPNIVAQCLKQYLSRHPELDTRIEKTGKRRYLTTGDPKEVSRKSNNLMASDHIAFAKY